MGEFAEPVSQFTSVDLSLCFVFQAAHVVFVGWPVCSVSVGFQLDLKVCHHQVVVRACICSSFNSDVQQASPPLPFDGDVVDLVLSPPIW